MGAAGAAGRPVPGRVPRASEVRPALFTRFVPAAGQGGQLPPIQTTSVSETPFTPLGRADQAPKRLVFGPPLDASAIAAERMRKLVALPVLSADALSSVAYGPQAMLAVLVLAGLPTRRTRCPSARRFVPDAGGRDLLPPDDPGLPARRRVLHRHERRNSAASAPWSPTGQLPLDLHEQRPDLTLTVTLPELVYRNWWHRSLHEHVAERLQSVLRSLPRVVVTSVPLGAQGRDDRPV